MSVDAAKVDAWSAHYGRRLGAAMAAVVLWNDARVDAAVREFHGLLGYFFATIPALRAELDAWEREGGPKDDIAVHRANLDDRWAWVLAVKRRWDAETQPVAAEGEVGVAPAVVVLSVGLMVTVVGLAWMAVCLDDGRTQRQDLDVEALAIRTGRGRKPRPDQAGAGGLLVAALAALGLGGGAWFYFQRRKA